MATIVFRRKSRKVYVYVWDKKLGKQVQVSRAITKQWDNLPEPDARKQIEEWEASQADRYKVKRKTAFSDSLATQLFSQYKEHREGLTENRSKTYENERDYFYQHILPFFTEKEGLKDPAQWHSKVPDFVPYLLSKNLKSLTIKKVTGVLTRFGEFLVYSRYMNFNYLVKTPKAKKQKTTPLKQRITPEQVLNLKLPNTELRLLLLISYFASLGPGESIALIKADFLTGNTAKESCRTYEGLKKEGLGSGLGVIICKSIEASGKLVSLVKTDYRYGVVNIFNSEAAKAIAALLKDKPDGPLFSFSRSYADKLWAQNVKPYLPCTLHDLRRASLLYLGRTKRLPPTLLQEHARHADLATTMLYCRDPHVPEVSSNQAQDFSDVS